jgi:uncharacterized membrane protein
MVAGGSAYCFIEIIGRGYSHISMFLLGGICFFCIGLLNQKISYDMPLWKQMVLGGGIITTLEFITGCIVNIWLNLNVWDYSDMPFNVLGQICLPFSLLWVLLSLVAIILDDYLRYWLFNEEKPHYKLF